jgi:phosphohistidine swiveling domain-containing protein
MSLIFSTKARTLASLSGCLHSARILPFVYFSVIDWKKNKQNCLTRLSQEVGDVALWIVRSSCKREDNHNESNAGAFLSLINITKNELENAIEEVIASYGKYSEDDEVLVQPMLLNVIRAGVAFSHDPNTSAPYRIINWSEGSDTTAVTGGIGGFVWQQAARSPYAPPKKLVNVMSLLNELLQLFDNIPIDCEFAVSIENNNEEVLWLLQARPLIFKDILQTEEDQVTQLNIIHQKIELGIQPHPFLIGRRTIYGVMPDWNPAEIVGIRPKPLALSLYRELITDAIWAYQRHNYGYRNLRSFPLMPHFFGLPYIDVRLSFNSFIPADLEDNLAGRLVDYYIERLLNEPTLHDKVEFEIVFSCYTLDLPERLKCLLDVGFSKKDCELIANSLRKLTNRVIHPEKGLWREDAAKLETLNDRREALFASNLDPIERIYWLLEDAKRYGTLPFAGLARAGFIAVQMLKSLVTVGVLSQVDYDAFMASISTVSGQLARDRAILDRSTFLARYGHLRPGTYDILSTRYDETPDVYFDWTQKPNVPAIQKPFSFTLPQIRELVKQLDAHGLHPDPVGLFDFLQAGIELRELAKFQFTRNLSDALALMVEYGEKLGFSRLDLAYCDISNFKELYVGATDPKDLISRSIEQGKERYKKTLSLSLPSIIASPSDIWGFQYVESSPNFITQKQITAQVVNCNQSQKALKGAIVCIPNADPGFDWLFSHSIAGLITAWGGVNSHMAIRSGELGLPAVIGAGEQLYRSWSNAQKLHIDCAGRKVEILA